MAAPHPRYPSQQPALAPPAVLSSAPRGEGGVGWPWVLLLSIFGGALLLWMLSLGYEYVLVWAHRAKP